MKTDPLLGGKLKFFLTCWGKGRRQACFLRKPSRALTRKRWNEHRDMGRMGGIFHPRALMMFTIISKTSHLLIEFEPLGGQGKADLQPLRYLAEVSKSQKPLAVGLKSQSIGWRLLE